MGIPESKFKHWTGTGADKGSQQAKEKIESLLRMDRSPVEQSDGSYKIRLQGSYKNHTHTYGSSDVDIIAKLTSAWTKDLSTLTQEERDRYHRYHSSAKYNYEKFSRDIWKWLSSKFTGDTISWSGKAIEINKKSPRVRVDVDLVPCVEHRVYTSYPAYGKEEYKSGMAFDPRYSNDTIVNFPNIHYENGCQKHSNYKKTVRIFKNARDYYNDHDSTFWTIDAHSYGIECLIYNVPRRILKRSSNSDRFSETLGYLADADLTQFHQVSEMEPLFGNSNTQWDLREAEELVTRLQEMWDDWPLS